MFWHCIQTDLISVKIKTILNIYLYFKMPDYEGGNDYGIFQQVI